MLVHVYVNEALRDVAFNLGTMYKYGTSSKFIPVKINFFTVYVSNPHLLIWTNQVGRDYFAD